MLATSTRLLTEEQIDFFNLNGYLVVKGLFTPEQIAELRDTFQKAGEKDGEVPGLWSPNKQSADPLDHFPRMMHPHKQPTMDIGALSLRFGLEPKVGAMLNELTNEEQVLAQTMYYFKPAGSRGQSLHQDNYYLRVNPGTCYAAWLAVDRCDAENGALVVVPGTHDHPIACPQKADLKIFWSTDHVPTPEGKKETLVEMEPGDMLFFNGSIIHGSYPNTSKNRFRRSFISHYVPATSTEVSAWYRPLIRFKTSEEIAIAEATGGGPCGEQAKGPH